jgi:hypothetical protein
VRMLVGGENPLFGYELNIIRVVSYLELGEKAVICCRAGVFRSNAIALWVLAYYLQVICQIPRIRRIAFLVSKRFIK